MGGNQDGRGAPRASLGDRVRFALERFAVRGLGHRLLLAAGIVASVAFTGGFLAFALGGFSTPEDSVWWAFLRLTDPGYLGDDEGVALRTISTVLTVLGYMLFLGLLIAILTQWLNQTLDHLQSGVTPIALSNHVIVLGWTGRTPSIVADLLAARQRARSFLSEHRVRVLRVIVLAERVDAALRQELRERLGPLWDDRRVLLRSGTPLRLDHLERVAFRSAAALILPGADFAERSPEAADAQVVKTLVSVAQHAHDGGSTPPHAVAELFDARQMPAASRAYGENAQVLATDRIVNRLIAQGMQSRGMHAVFHELLTLGLGNALHFRPVPELAGARFGGLRGAFSRAVALGLVRPERREAVLHPDPETVIAEDDALVLVARSSDDCTPVPGATTAESGAAPRECRRPLDVTRHVLILGWSRKVPALLQELQAYGADAFEIDVVSATPLDERERQLARYGAGLIEGRIRHHEAGFTAPGVLEQLRPERYQQIVLLASERASEEEEADAATVLGWLRLRELLPTSGGPEVLVELLGEENRLLIPDPRVCVLVSPEVMSYVVSQSALRPELAPVFDELSRPYGPQMVAQPLEALLPEAPSVSFRQLEEAAAARGQIAMGFYRGEGFGELALNPERDAHWRCQPGDLAVCLTSYADGPPGED